MRDRRNLEVIAGRVLASGAIDEGEGFTITGGGTGVMIVRFPSNFRLISCTGSSNGAIVMVDSFSQSGCRFVTPQTIGGAAVAAAVWFVAVGYRV